MIIDIDKTAYIDLKWLQNNPVYSQSSGFACVGQSPFALFNYQTEVPIAILGVCSGSESSQVDGFCPRNWGSSKTTRKVMRV